MTNSESQGFVDISGFKIYYESFGEPGEKGTVLVLHGGPGSTHDYLLSLKDLTQFGYRVIFYDQLGCGRSDVPPEDSFFTVDNYVEEVEKVRQSLGLSSIHLLGQSWGGMLALAYALRYQSNLKSLIIASGLASVPLTVSEMQRLRSEFPKDIQDVLKKYEANGDLKNPEYVRVLRLVYKKHLNRLEDWPEELVYSMNHTGRPYYVMWGPDEFTCTGTLMNWDITNQLHKLKVPCLITVGRHDEVTPKVAESMHKEIRGSKMVIFENSSHQAMWEEREDYMRAVGDFLSEKKR